MDDMTDEERQIAVWTQVGKLDDLLGVERLILSAISPHFTREQEVRVLAIERARDALVKSAHP